MSITEGRLTKRNNGWGTVQTDSTRWFCARTEPWASCVSNEGLGGDPNRFLVQNDHGLLDVVGHVLHWKEGHGGEICCVSCGFFYERVAHRVAPFALR